jgi:hypothetical protein
MNHVFKHGIKFYPKVLDKNYLDFNGFWYHLGIIFIFENKDEGIQDSKWFFQQSF